MTTHLHLRLHGLYTYRSIVYHIFHKRDSPLILILRKPFKNVHGPHFDKTSSKVCPRIDKHATSVHFTSPYEKSLITESLASHDTQQPQKPIGNLLQNLTAYVLR